MSRSGYSDDCEGWELIMWRGAVKSAIRGKRGQAFLRELIEALDALPEKRLIDHELQDGGEVCSLGSVGVRRGIDLSQFDPSEHERLANAFGIAGALVQEVEYMNDEGTYLKETPEAKWIRMRAWAVENLVEVAP